MVLPVYMDYAAAAPVDPRVAKVMYECLAEGGTFANAASKDHIYGWQAAEVVEDARAQVAELVGASPLEIIFTSGATESNNLAIQGLARALRRRGDPRRHIVTSMIEHKAVIETCRYLEEEGYKVTFLRPNDDGSIDCRLLDPVLTEDTFLVSIMHANSVIGTVNDIKSLAALCHERGIYFHTDCAQSAGWFNPRLDDNEISLASLTPEKIYGPKGVGALYINKAQRVPLEPMIFGGGHEKGLRSGTLATHQIVGMGEAFRIMQAEGPELKVQINYLRDKLKAALMDLGGVRINGSKEHHLPGVLSATFTGVDGLMLLPSLRQVAASTGSACSSSELKPSYVLKAIGLSDQLARSSVRFSIGRFTTEADIDRAVADIQGTVRKLRAAGNFWTVRK